MWEIEAMKTFRAIATKFKNGDRYNTQISKRGIDAMAKRTGRKENGNNND